MNCDRVVVKPIVSPNGIILSEAKSIAYLKRRVLSSHLATIKVRLVKVFL
jgi:hypothetical protein